MKNVSSLEKQILQINIEFPLLTDDSSAYEKEVAQAKIAVMESLLRESELLQVPPGIVKEIASLNEKAAFYYGYVIMNKPLAVLHCEKALNIRKLLFHNANHPDLANTYQLLGRLNDSLGNTVVALANFQEARKMRNALYPKGHLDLAKTLNNIGLCLSDIGKEWEALDALEESLVMRRQLYPLERFPKGHTVIANALVSMGSIYAKIAEAYADSSATDTYRHGIKAISLYRDAVKMLSDLKSLEHVEHLTKTIAELEGGIVKQAQAALPKPEEKEHKMREKTEEEEEQTGLMAGAGYFHSGVAAIMDNKKEVARKWFKEVINLFKAESLITYGHFTYLENRAKQLRDEYNCPELAAMFYGAIVEISGTIAVQPVELQPVRARALAALRLHPNVQPAGYQSPIPPFSHAPMPITHQTASAARVVEQQQPLVQHQPYSLDARASHKSSISANENRRTHVDLVQAPSSSKRTCPIL